MRFKLLSLFAVALLVAACETTPETSANSTGGGNVVVPPPTEPGDLSMQEDMLLKVGDRIFFAFDRSDLNGESQSTLRKMKDWMEDNRRVTITIEGHCDERGTREYNLALGERRADAARDYLVALGISGGRITTISYGKERPAVLGSSEGSWAQNRRDVFVVN